MINIDELGPNNLLTPRQVAEVLGIGVATLATWRSRSRSRGPDFIKIGGSVRYRVVDVREYICNATAQAAVGLDGDQDES